MTWLDAIILGAVQGLTEFLPISSSGHLTLGGLVLGLEKPNLLFDILVHVATLIAVTVVFWDDLKAMTSAGWRALRASGRTRRLQPWLDDPHARLVGLVLLATIPTGIIGVAAGSELSLLTSNAAAVGVILILNGFVLLATQPLAKREGTRMQLIPAIVVGMIQGLAVLRGLSRSGTTIATGMLMGVDRSAAARFSFLLSIPAILGAMVLEFDPAELSHGDDLGAYAAGFVASGLVGYGALRGLLFIVGRGRLHLFAPYCWLVGALSIWQGL